MSSIYCPLSEALGIETTISILSIDPYPGSFDESGCFIPWNKGKRREPFSDEWRRNMSRVKIGKRHSEETKQKISAAHKGKIFSKEHRDKIGQSKKGAAFYESDEYREKQRLGRLGKKHTDQTKRKIARSGEEHPMFGKKHSEDTKRKMSMSRIGKKRGPYKRKVMQDGCVS